MYYLALHVENLTLIVHQKEKRWTGKRQEDVEDFVATLLEHLDTVSPTMQELFIVKHCTDIRCSDPQCNGVSGSKAGTSLMLTADDSPQKAPTQKEDWHSLRLQVPLGGTEINVQTLLDNYLIELATTQTISSVDSSRG